MCFNHSVESSAETEGGVDVETEEVHSLGMVDLGPLDNGSYS